MKILFVAPRFHTNQSTIVKTLINKGHRVYFHVSTIGPTEDYSNITPEIIEESILSIIRTKIFGDGGKNKKGYFPKIIKYYSVIKKISPDILIIRRHGRVFSYMATFYGRLCKAKIVFYDQIHSSYYLKNHSQINNYFKKIKLLFILKFFNAKWFTPLHNLNNNSNLPNRCYYLPFAVDIKVNDEIKINNPVRLLTVGKYYKRKNHNLLINALSQLNGDNDFHLTIVGEVSNENHDIFFSEIKDLVKSKQMNNKIDFITNVPFNKMKSIYKSNDLFILPATDEPASISILEAMGYGLPVICSDSCGTKNYIKNNYNGSIFESGNVDSLQKHISKYVNNFDLLIQQKKWISENINGLLSGENYYHYFKKMINI